MFFSPSKFYSNRLRIKDRQLSIRAVSLWLHYIEGCYILSMVTYIHTIYLSEANFTANLMV